MLQEEGLLLVSNLHLDFKEVLLVRDGVSQVLLQGLVGVRDMRCTIT